MKIAIVHNDYGKFSGEEAVVRDHSALLASLGHEVVFFRRSSAELKGVFGNLKGFVSGLGNPVSKRRFAKFLDREKPEIVHIHNLYPLITPFILPEAKKRHIPVVMTVHNFRLFCPNGLFAVNNGVCEECAKQQSLLPALRKNCLGSPLKTIGYVLRTKTAQHFRWYWDNVDRFFCLTEFQRDKLLSYGLPPEKCVIIPNFIDEQWLAEAGNTPLGDRSYVAYMGRLSEEKGMDLLLDAARALPEISFKIAGNGAENYRAQAPANVEFVGYLTGKAQFEFIRHARLQLMMSRCYENFPTTLLQGMALGIPSVVPRLGGMPGIVGQAGVSFNPGDAEDLTAKLAALWSDENACRIAAQEAKFRVTALFSPVVVGKELEKNYRNLLAR